jgi:hypothetical protein
VGCSLHQAESRYGPAESGNPGSPRRSLNGMDLECHPSSVGDEADVIGVRGDHGVAEPESASELVCQRVGVRAPWERWPECQEDR